MCVFMVCSYYIYVCMYAGVCVCVHVCFHVCVFECVYLWYVVMCMYVCMHADACARVCVCIVFYVSKNAYRCLFMCVRTTECCYKMT